MYSSPAVSVVVSTYVSPVTGVGSSPEPLSFVRTNRRNVAALSSLLLVLKELLLFVM